MRTVLLTNDDGIDSPTLPPLARAARALGDVQVVVPDSERSWIGKAITRFDSLRVRRAERDGIPMLAVSGTPADCVSLAVHSLGLPRPDVVLSGINLGLNVGLAFVLSSGTVGAALEGWIAGIPSIAFSMAIPRDAYGLSGLQRVEALGDRPPRAAAVACELADIVLRHGFPADVDCFSINMPADVTIDTPRVVAPVTRTRYGRLFVPGPDDDYLHRFHSLTVLAGEAIGDLQVVERGAVAIAPLRLEISGRVSEELAAALTQGRG